MSHFTFVDDFSASSVAWWHLKIGNYLYIYTNITCKLILVHVPLLRHCEQFDISEILLHYLPPGQMCSLVTWCRMVNHFFSSFSAFPLQVLQLYQKWLTTGWIQCISSLFVGFRAISPNLAANFLAFWQMYKLCFRCLKESWPVKNTTSFIFFASI